MIQSTILQDLIARLDLLLPWLLPALEIVDQTIPQAIRLPTCALLMVWFAVLRQRGIMATAGQVHRVAL